MGQISSRIMAFMLVFVMAFTNTGYVYGADQKNELAQTAGTKETDYKNDTASDISKTNEPEALQSETADMGAEKASKAGTAETVAAATTVGTDRTAETETESEKSSGTMWNESQTVDGVTITVTADAGVFPGKAFLSVSKVTDRKDQNQIEGAIEGERSSGLNVAEKYTFDIKVLDTDGHEIEPDNTRGSVHVSFAVAEAPVLYDAVEVYHVEKDEDGHGTLDAQALDTQVKSTENSSGNNTAAKKCL